MERVANTVKVFIEECDIATFEPFHAAAIRAQRLAANAATAIGSGEEAGQNSVQNGLADWPPGHRKTPRRTGTSVVSGSALDASPNNNDERTMSLVRSQRTPLQRQQQLLAAGTRGAAVRQAARRRGERQRQRLECSGTLLVFEKLAASGAEEDELQENLSSYDSAEEGVEAPEEVDLEDDQRAPRPRTSYRVFSEKY